MNPFLAYIDFASSPRTGDWLSDVENKLRALPHDRFECLDRPDVWIAQASLDTGAIAADRATPRVSDDGRYVVVFSGWIENRDEIDALLAESRPREQACDDVERALAGWKQWGNELANKLYGEYAIVIFDSSDKNVISIRDKIGIQPLFYWANSEKAIWSNLPGLVALSPFVGKEINDGYLAEFLHANLCSLDETLFKNVTRVPGGHWMRFSASGGVQVNRYWQPEATIIQRPVNEILAEFERILFEVVKSAATTTHPATVEISGGLDSSSVAVTLNEIVNRGEMSADRIKGASKAFPGLPCDETLYSDSVAAVVAFRCSRLSPELPTRANVEQWTKQLNYPAYPYALFTSMRHYQTMRLQGSRVVITGEGGDELFRASALTCRHLFRSPRYIKFWAHVVVQLWRERPRSASLLGQIRHTIRPWLGEAFDDWISRLRSRQRAHHGLRINPSWAQAVDFYGRTGKRPPPQNARVAMVAGALDGSFSQSEENASAFACLFGVEQRHPLCSARMAEFFNRLPAEFFDELSSITKWPLREIMLNRLPELVRRRRDKAEFTPALLPGLQQIAREQFVGLVANQEADAGSQRSIKVDLTAKYIWALSAASSFEIWMREQPNGVNTYTFESL